LIRLGGASNEAAGLVRGRSDRLARTLVPTDIYQGRVIQPGIRVKIRKAIVASGALVPLLTLALSGTAQANGVGDLYVASSSGVLEVHVTTSTVIGTIPVVPAPQSLAFSPDGRTLYASNASSKVVPIDIATLDLQASITMPGNVSAVAFPAGQRLVAAMPTRRTLAFAIVHGGAVTESAQLPGSGNILAGDRREARVAVAEAGKSWLGIVDPATETLKRATVAGGVVALAIERDHGGVLVATQNPNALLRLDLASLATTWTVALSGAPTAVASMPGAAIVATGTSLLKVDGKKEAAFATTKQPAITLNVSDEGAFIHVAESSSVEVFDAKGKLQRTLGDLKDEHAVVAMASVPRGSSLYLGEGAAGSTATPRPSSTTAAALATGEPPTTSTLVDEAGKIASQPQVRGGAMVAGLILFLCWFAIRWYDRRVGRRA
jgi:DNA-binding beta-propeller fold protein YncE